MELLKTTVREDWQEIAQQMISENAKLWRIILVTVILSALAVLAIGLLPPSWAWRDLLQIAASSAVFCILPLWFVHRSQSSMGWLTLSICLLLLGSTAIAFFTRPLSTGNGIVSTWPVGFVVLVPIISWLILAWSHRVMPEPMGYLGLVTDRWPINLAIGTAAGGALGFHLLLTIGLAPDSNFVHAPTLMWAFCYYAGLQALGEELLFRGLSFPLLSEGLNEGFWKALIKVTMLNLLIYSALVLQSPQDDMVLWAAVYRMVLAMVAVFLRYWQRSLVPCLACNIVFSIFTVMVTK